MNIMEIWKLFLVTFISATGVCFADSNGGATCAACAVVFGLAEQTSVIYNETLVHSLDRLCGYLPDQYQKECKTFLDYVGPILLVILEEEYTPDVICHRLGLCYTEKGRTCNLFPLKNKNSLYHYSKDPLLVQKTKRMHMPKIGVDICTLPGIKEICDWINDIFDKHDPAIDLDGDRHSTYETLRGYSWRGKDCDDSNGRFHPGAKPVNADAQTDSNCNGIKGIDPTTKIPYETTFCAGSDQRGVAVLGDSIGAHFHLPREWFNSTELSVANFEPLPFILENEFDWPELSFTTGFMNATEELARVIHGHTDSLYLRMWQRNRCNFRDYQNIAVNGARASSMAGGIDKSLSRNMTFDYPMFITYELVGNDVCNGHPDTISHMTEPKQMKQYATQTVQYLDQILPPGSFVFFTGLADGRVLYDSLSHRIHPIGSLRNDVTYAHFYDYFNCLETSPCSGWMNTNETLRNLTTERAMELSKALQEVAQDSVGKTKNFKLYFFDNPFYAVINEWKKAGKPVWELLEPVDGFHANQKANAEISRTVWEQLLTKYPEVIGKENPYNEKIQNIFGDQGGYR